MTLSAQNGRLIVTQSFDLGELTRVRRLRVMQGSDRYAFPPDPLYDPARSFCDYFAATGGYPFSLVTLIQVAAQKMLGQTLGVGAGLFAAGGLYLALDPSHANLAFQNTFGDFTSGFSHQYGVALATMTMSEAFNVPWDQMVPIPVKGRKELDYEVPIGPNSWLRLEAKGVVTSRSSANRNAAMANAFKKKFDPDPPAGTPAIRRTYPQATAMIAVVTEAGRSPAENGSLTVIDPPLATSDERRKPHNQEAAYWSHYARIASAAGLFRLAAYFSSRAAAVSSDLAYESPMFPERHFVIDKKSLHARDSLVGIQWPLQRVVAKSASLWIYQGVHLDHLLRLAMAEKFRPAAPFRNPLLMERSSTEGDWAESHLPDAAYLGIGLGPRPGFAVVEPDSWSDIPDYLERVENQVLSSPR